MSLPRQREKDGRNWEQGFKKGTQILFCVFDLNGSYRAFQSLINHQTVHYGFSILLSGCQILICLKLKLVTKRAREYIFLTGRVGKNRKNLFKEKAKRRKVKEKIINRRYKRRL